MNIGILNSPRRHWVATSIKNRFPNFLEKMTSEGFSDWSGDYEIYNSSCYFNESKDFSYAPKDIAEYLNENIGELDNLKSNLVKKFQTLIIDTQFEEVPVVKMQILKHIKTSLNIGQHFMGLEVEPINYWADVTNYHYNGWTAHTSNRKINFLTDEHYGRFFTKDVMLYDIGISRTNMTLPNSTDELFDMCYNPQNYFK